MPIFRTPDERFANLPDYPFEPNYVHIDHRGEELRVHYLDEGPADAPPIVCLHGEPTWSFLYRKMIPILAEKHRVIVPDFIGFGKSDKFTKQGDYTLGLHTGLVRTLFDRLGLQGVTLVVQDWGGLIGLKVATEIPERMGRLVVMNTFLPTGEEKKSPAFAAWRTFAKRSPVFPISTIVAKGCATDLPKAVTAGYDAPFPNRASKAGARAWPAMVPMAPTDPVAQPMRDARAGLAEWTKPVRLIYAPGDPILGRTYRFFQKLFPHAGEPVFIDNASHFLQEDQGETVAREINAFISSTE
ncbi:MAG: haloalkane dehalogenase [Bacteroidota bacterium]